MARDYVPLDDGLEPTDYDEYYDYPAKTDRDLAARFYVKIERDPKRAADLMQRQNAAILELLQVMLGPQDGTARQGPTTPPLLAQCHSA